MRTALPFLIYKNLRAVRIWAGLFSRPIFCFRLLQIKTTGKLAGSQPDANRHKKKRALSHKEQSPKLSWSQ